MRATGLCCTPETNIIVYVNCNKIKKYSYRQIITCMQYFFFFLIVPSDGDPEFRLGDLGAYLSHTVLG